jgi:hypothetical protein
MHETRSDVIVCVALAVALFSASLIPWLLLVNAEHLCPRRVRELPATVRKSAFQVALSGLALLFICTAPSEASRA